MIMTARSMLSVFLLALMATTVRLAGGGSEVHAAGTEDKGRLFLILVSVLLSLFLEEFGFRNPFEEDAARPSVCWQSESWVSRTKLHIQVRKTYPVGD
jgi:hypothetical protein